MNRCATCVLPVDLAVAHVTVVRQVEIERARGVDTVVQESAVVDYWHPECAPPLGWLAEHIHEGAW